MRAITAKGVYTRKLEEASGVRDDTIIKTERGKEMYVSVNFKTGFVEIHLDSVTSHWERNFYVFHENGRYVKHEGIRNIPMPIKAFLSELGMVGIQ